MRTGVVCALSLAVFAVLCVGTADAAVIGIDFGTEWIKTAIVRRGKPLSIVENEASKRKTPALLTFVAPDEVIVGEAAQSKAIRKPATTARHLTRLLGKTPADATVLASTAFAPFPTRFIDDPERPGTISLGMGADSSYSVEELAAMLLAHVREHAEAAAGGERVVDATIAVPPFYGQRERQAIKDAAVIAGLNPRLVSVGTAAAVQYSTKVGFKPDVHTALFYDMGSGSTKATLVTFQQTSKLDGKVNKTIDKLHVKSVAWDATLGGHEFDARVAEWLERDFLDKHGPFDQPLDARTRAKLQKEAIKVKTVLSANTEMQVYMEGLWNDIDYRTMLKREQFEEMCRDLIERAAKPVTAAIELAELSVDEVDAVVVVGGASRIPAVQTQLRQAIGGRDLTFNLNGDEAVALGAAFLGAVSGPSFRLTREHQFRDVTPYTIAADLRPVQESDAGGAAADEADVISNVMFHAQNRVPSRKQMKLRRTEDLEVTLRYQDDEPRDPDAPATLLVARLEGVRALYDKYNQTDKPHLTLAFRLNEDGMAEIATAEASVDVVEPVEVEEEVEVPMTEEEIAAAKEKELEDSLAAKGDADVAEDAATMPEDGDDGDAAAAAADTADADASDAKAEEEPRQWVKKEKRIRFEQKNRTKTKRLTVTAVEYAGVNNSTRLLDASKDRLAILQEAEAQRQRTATARNELESYVYAKRDSIEAEEAVAVSTAEQRDAAIAALDAEAEWLYGDGVAADADTITDHLTSVQSLCEPILLRVDEVTAVPEAVAALEAAMAETAEFVVKMAPKTNSTRLTNDTLIELDRQVNRTRDWLAEQTEAQGKLAAHEDRALLSTDIRRKIETLERRMASALRLSKAKKPKASSSSSSSKKKKTKKVKIPVPDGEDIEIDVPEDFDIDAMKRESEKRAAEQAAADAANADAAGETEPSAESSDHHEQQQQDEDNEVAGDVGDAPAAETPTTTGDADASEPATADDGEA